MNHSRSVIASASQTDGSGVCEKPRNRIARCGYDADRETHQFLEFIGDDLERVDCPKGWMSPEGYVRYVDTTLAKMREREAAKKHRQSK